MKNIGEKIRKLREVKKISQEKMAIELEISQRAYSKIENNQIKIDWTRIEKIANILEIEPTELVYFEEKDEEKYLFKNCKQSGRIDILNNNFPQELKESYENRIKHLEEEIVFLRNLLSKE